jgi:dipeptide/tripeptide permease
VHEVYEVFERMAYYGISSNLVLYLTTKLHQGVVPSANNVTNWVGTVWMTPIIGAYIADTHLGRYRTFMVASVIYLTVSRRRRPHVGVLSVSVSAFMSAMLLIILESSLYYLNRKAHNRDLYMGRQSCDKLN